MIRIAGPGTPPVENHCTGRSLSLYLQVKRGEEEATYRGSAGSAGSLGSTVSDGTLKRKKPALLSPRQRRRTPSCGYCGLCPYKPEVQRHRWVQQLRGVRHLPLHRYLQPLPWHQLVHQHPVTAKLQKGGFKKKSCSAASELFLGGGPS